MTQYSVNNEKRERIIKLLGLVRAQSDLFTHDALYEILVRYAGA